MVDCIVTPTIIGLVFMRGLFLGIVFCFFMDAWVLALTLVFVVVWASIFSCIAVGWKDFFVFVLLSEPVLLGSSSIRKPR